MSIISLVNAGRKLNFKKSISHSEPLKCARVLVLGSKVKFKVFQKRGKNFLCTVHRNLCRCTGFCAQCTGPWIAHTVSWTELVFTITLHNKFADPQPVSHPGKSVSQHSVAGFEPNFVSKVSRNVSSQLWCPTSPKPNLDIFLGPKISKLILY